MQEVSMSIGRAIKRRVKGAVPPLIFLSLVGYFLWNAVQGDRGLLAYRVREQQLTAVQAEFHEASAERDTWEARVAGLRAKHIDGDALDERARSMLNLADPDDIVVPYGPGRNLF